MKFWMRFLGSSILFSVFGIPGAWCDTLLYQQASLLPASTVLSSQNDPKGLGNFATMYDDFSLSAAGSINKITWMGGWFNGGGVGNISAFKITFWSDAPGQPGSPLFSTVITGNANSTFVGNSSLGIPTYSYAALFVTPFNAAAGTRYWVSIVPDTAGLSPQWGWDSTLFGGDSIQDFFGIRNTSRTDLTFALYSAPASALEPGSLILLGAGLVFGLVALRRKTRNQELRSEL